MNKARIKRLAKKLAADIGQTGIPHREAHIRAALTAAVRETIEEDAKVAESVSPRHTECGNKIAAAIRARAAEMEEAMKLKNIHLLRTGTETQLASLAIKITDFDPSFCRHLFSLSEKSNK